MHSSDYIRMALTETGCKDVNWRNQAQDMGQYQDVVSKYTFRFHKIQEIRQAWRLLGPQALLCSMEFVFRS
jgi:hypothetical protein